MSGAARIGSRLQRQARRGLPSLFLWLCTGLSTPAVDNQGRGPAALQILRGRLWRLGAASQGHTRSTASWSLTVVADSRGRGVGMFQEVLRKACEFSRPHTQD